MKGWFRSFGTLAQVQGEGHTGYFVEFSYDLDNMTSGLLADMEDTVVKEKEAVMQQLSVWEEHMREMNGSEKQMNFAGEFKPYGLLDRFYRQLERGEPVDLKNVLRELLMQDTMANVIQHIESN